MCLASQNIYKPHALRTTEDKNKTIGINGVCVFLNAILVKCGRFPSHRQPRRGVTEALPADGVAEQKGGGGGGGGGEGGDHHPQRGQPGADIE